MIDKNTIYNEMMIHIPLCTHKIPKKVLVVGKTNDLLKDEIKKHSVDTTYVNDINIDDKFDVVIYNKHDLDDMVMANVNRVLDQEEGIFVTTSSQFKKDSQNLIDDLKLLGKSFWITMPYKFGHTMAILSSKKYHPQADIILDRSDFLECEYYNTELHNAAFVHPTYITKALTGIAKR